MLCHKPLSVDTAVCWCYCCVQMSSDAMSPTAVGYCGVQMSSDVMPSAGVCCCGVQMSTNALTQQR